MYTFKFLKKWSHNKNHYVQLADPTSFMKLRELVVEDCFSLKCLFSSSVAGNLLQLNRLEIRNCNQLEEVVVTNQRMDKLLFPQLYFVMLNNLPKLKRFCSGAVLECPRLVELQMKGCPQLTSSVSISEHEHLSWQRTETNEVRG